MPNLLIIIGEQEVDEVVQFKSGFWENAEGCRKHISDAVSGVQMRWRQAGFVFWESSEA